ncbi:MAG: hypothetical protein ACODAG_05195, partial [Myxococcota bacterium]
MRTAAPVWMAALLLLGAGGSLGACASSERPEVETPTEGASEEASEEAPAEAEVRERPDEVAEEEAIECEGPPVELAFGWPRRLEARVKSLELIEIEDSRGEEPARHGVPTEHRLEVSPGGEDRLHVQFAAVGDGRPRLDGLIMEYGGERPTLVVGEEEGNLLALEGVGKMKASHDEVSEEQGLDEKEAAEIFQRLREEPLLDDARGWWHLVVSGWAGRRIGCDEAQTETREMPIKTLGGVSVPVAIEWRYLGEVPCGEGSGRQGQTCVELAALVQADPAQTQKLLEGRVQAASGAQGNALRVQRAELVRMVRVRVEPETLVLHRVRAE